MRGLPLIRLAIVIALFLLALIPLTKLTAEKAVTPPTQTAVTAGSDSFPTQIEITSSPTAAQFQILHLGKVVWEGTGDKAVTTLKLPEKLFDLQVQATWTAKTDGENAIRVRVSREDLPLADSTFWGKENVEDVLSVPAN